MLVSWFIYFVVILEKLSSLGGLAQDDETTSKIHIHSYTQNLCIGRPRYLRSFLVPEKSSHIEIETQNRRGRCR